MGVKDRAPAPPAAPAPSPAPTTTITPRPGRPKACSHGCSAAQPVEASRNSAGSPGRGEGIDAARTSTRADAPALGAVAGTRQAGSAQRHRDREEEGEKTVNISTAAIIALSSFGFALALCAFVVTKHAHLHDLARFTVCEST